MHMKVLQAGALTTIQDRGRVGYLEYGIGSSGVMDALAYKQLNELLGNDQTEAVLEMTLFGARLQFDEDVLIAYTGAEMNATFDETIPIERGRVYELRKGKSICFGMAKSGVRAYVAIAGTIDVPIVMGSKSTNLKCALGGFEGRKLQNGDEIPVTPRCDSPEKVRRMLERQIAQPKYEKKKNIHVILGPQENMFLKEGLDTFFGTEYTVSTECDRMGIRLDGSPIWAKSGTDIISDGIVMGSIQVTPAGLPIIMMAEHQTTGGYAKIATVISEDLPKLAQARPGDLICFEKVEIGALQRKGWKLFGR